MTDALHSLKILSVALAVLANFMFGGVWYQIVVKRAYARALGKQMKGGLPALLVPLACNTITTITSAVFLKSFEIKSYDGAIKLAILVSVGYLIPTILNVAWNPLFPRPFYYTLINAPYFLIGNILADLILVAFQ